MKEYEIDGQHKWNALTADHEAQWYPKYLVGKIEEKLKNKQ